MISRKSDKNGSGQIISLFNNAQKLVLQIRPTPNQNNSFDISAVTIDDEVDQSDPLRLPEIFIVVGVLLIWCGSIFIFIRHSQLLRIRHRDLPFRSSVKSPINTNYMTISHCNSELNNSPRVHLSMNGGTTPSLQQYSLHNNQQSQSVELRSTSRTKHDEEQRQTRSFDYHSSFSLTKDVPMKTNEKEYFIDPDQIPTEVKESLFELHQQSVENITHFKGITSYSVNDLIRQKTNDSLNARFKKRCVQESPV